MIISVEQQRYRTTRRITLLTALVNAFLSILKMFFGIVGHSHALFADGIHSLADLLSDGLVLCAARFGSIAADENHHYGHGKIETVGAALLAVLLVIVGAGISYNAIHLFWHPSLEHPRKLVLIVAAISVVLNELIFHYSRRVAQEIHSDLLLANAWHHRSDALSSVVVLLGVSGTLCGLHYLDAVAAVIVALMIIQMAWSLVWSSLQELIDTAVDETTLQKIKDSIATVVGVIELHQLRTRLMRGHILVDVHIMVAEKISVSEGHHIAQQVRLTLERDIPQIIDVTVHVDPEDDEIAPPSIQLPSRQQLLTRLRPLWENCAGYEKMKEITLHYLNGKLQVVLCLPLSIATDRNSAEEIVNEYRQAVLPDDDIAEIKVIFC